MALSLDPVISLTNGGKDVNEDLVNTAGSAAWVLDGGTGYADSPFTGAESDAKWYVDTIDDYLSAHVSESSESLSGILKNAVKYASDEYRETVGDLPREAYLPTATAAIVRLNGETLEYLVLGDCRVLVSKAHTIATVTDSRMQPIEQMAIEAVLETVKQRDVTVGEARELVIDRFERNRKLANTSEGYWVLTINPEAVAHALTGSFEVDEETSVYLMSDGFSAIVDTYNLYEKWADVIEAIDHGESQELVAKMREVEQADSRCISYPRTKPSDDATLFSTAFNKNKDS